MVIRWRRSFSGDFRDSPRWTGAFAVLCIWLAPGAAVATDVSRVPWVRLMAAGWFAIGIVLLPLVVFYTGGRKMHRQRK